MERAKVFKAMSIDIKTRLIGEFMEGLKKKATKIKSDLRDWSRWEHNGRIYVGWKRANFSPLINVYSRFRFEPLSTIEIVRRKIRKWLDK